MTIAKQYFSGLALTPLLLEEKKVLDFFVFFLYVFVNAICSNTIYRIFHCFYFQWGKSIYLRK
jgi:hypothetical protein